jgi:hypothetical protein
VATQNTGTAEALALGITDALIAAFPELKAVRDLFAQERLADARLAYYNSNYYRDLTSTARDRQTKQAVQPGVFGQEKDAWVQAQVVRLVGKGVTATPAILAVLDQSYLSGHTDIQVDMAILNSGKLGTIGGSVLGKVGALKTIAYDQGVDNILPKAYWDTVSEGLFSGLTTEEDVKKQIDDIAMSAYPAYADGIKSGKTFGMQTSALRQMVANTLEIDVDTIGNNDPLFKKLVSYVNPETKKPEMVPLWDAEKITKSDSRWEYTKNAQATFDSLTRGILQNWGLAY